MDWKDAEIGLNAKRPPISENPWLNKNDGSNKIKPSIYQTEARKREERNRAGKKSWWKKYA